LEVSVRIAVGADHAGFELKESLLERLTAQRFEVVDVGTCRAEPVDYPDIAAAVSQAVLEGRVDRGVLICGSGVGASVAANKLPGIRAGLCHDTYSARQGVEHDDMNVLVLGSRVIGEELAWELVQAFLQARFSGEERHRRRLAKVAAMESAAAGTPERSTQ
jgi:RpiB/LacA/LacB family sugar-phosphate isomerase